MKSRRDARLPHTAEPANNNQHSRSLDEASGGLVFSRMSDRSDVKITNAPRSESHLAHAWRGLALNHGKGNDLSARVFL